VAQFGKYTYPSAKIVEAYKSLSLEPCFLAEHAGRLVGDRCRLDISGDIHHYARYWGTASTQEQVALASVNDRPNYAALVAGGGGAFLHASHTDVGQVPHVRVYPARPDSHNLMPVESFADSPRFRLVDVFTISCPQTGSLSSKERPA
jgi:hypothetical protein